jgi:iron-sulfur cluster repair protein YtfE (RIC family)
MSVLIEELKKDHSEIVDLLKEVKKLGILSKEGQAKLLSAKAHLLKHLNKEDEQLYPALIKKAETIKHLNTALDLCAIDMENVSRVVQEFFDKYSRGVSGKELQKEFENLCEALDKRVRNEEDILYDEYE